MRLPLGSQKPESCWGDGFIAFWLLHGLMDIHPLCSGHGDVELSATMFTARLFDFRQALENEFSESFSDIVFAITDWSPERRFLGPFRNVFSSNEG